jgi:hypothetical protein
MKELDRWFDAVTTALIGARSEGVLGRWRIVAGAALGDGAPDAKALARYRAQADERHGEFAWSSFDPELDPMDRHRHLLEEGDEELVLIVEADCVILSSTVTRMLQEYERSGAAVAARELPLDPNTDPYSGTGTQRGCVLYSRSTLGPSESAGRATGESIDFCQEAPVFRRSTVSRPLVAAPAGTAVATALPPLLAELADPPDLREIRDAVVRNLVPDSTLSLTVVMRTQVRRPEALRDALLCLAGQSDGRFEVLLVVHDAQADVARAILEDQPEWLRSRTRIIGAVGGTRSHPLNVGIAAATGSHIAFLDDDDLVFGHWVESFLDGAGSHPGRVVRAESGVQQVTTVSWTAGLEGHSTESAMSTPYPIEFDLADHIRVNMTPFMAFAFPHAFFSIFGGADEALEVCEDWDLVLRAASVLGVHDVPSVTSIYRRWISGRDSYSLDPAIWERDMARVRAKVDARPLLLPPGSASELAAMSAARTASDELLDVYGSSSWKVTAPLRGLAGLVRRLRKPPRIDA